VATSTYAWASYSPSLSTESTSYIVTYIRLEVADILKDMTKPKDEILARLKILKPYLEHLTHPLVSLLSTEITHIEDRLGQQLNTSVNLQASAFFALGRGLQSQMANDIQHMHIHSPFANSIQREITESIHNMTQGDPC
jgi:hypothetical protein